MPTGRTANWMKWTPVLLMVAVAAAFSNALPREFTYDSRPIVKEHPQLEPGTSWTTLLVSRYWPDTYSDPLYRPLTMLSYWIEKNLLGVTQPWPHAVVNIALHAATSFLLWRLALQWTGRSRAALAASLLFAVHPIATEVVPNLVGRADLLASLSVLGGLLLWERYLDRRQAWLLLVIAAVWFLGMLAKESAVVFPAAAAVRVLWREHVAKHDPLLRTFARAAVDALPGMVLLGLTMAVWLVLRRVALASGPPAWRAPLDNILVLATPTEHVLSVVMVWGLYLRQALLPLWLSADHSPSQLMLVTTPADPAFLAGAAALLLLGALIIELWRRRSPAVLGLAFFVLALLPVSNTLMTIGTMMADRLLYLPLAGLMLALGVGVDALMRVVSRPGRQAVIAGVVIAAVLLGVRTHQRNEAWITFERLWIHTLRDAPRSWRIWSEVMQNALAAPGPRTPERHDQLVTFAERLLETLRPLPYWAGPTPLLNAGAVYIDRGEFRWEQEPGSPAAEADLARGIDLTRRFLYVWQTDNPRYRAAMADDAYRRARGLELVGPHNEQHMAYINLGKAFYTLNHHDLASDALEKALTLRPDTDESWAWALYGRSLANVARFDAAEAALQRAIELSPENPQHGRDLEVVRRARATREAPPPTPDEDP